MNDRQRAFSLQEARLTAEKTLRVGESVVIFLENDAYQLSYLLDKVDGLPCYSFTNIARNETVTFDVYSIPELLSHLKLGANLDSNENRNSRDFPYREQNFQLRSTAACSPYDLREYANIQGLSNYYAELQSTVPSVLVKSENINKKIEIGKSYYSRGYLTKDYKGEQNKPYEGPLMPSVGKHFLLHGVPILEWNDPYSPLDNARKYSPSSSSRSDYLLKNESSLSERRELSFGWILHLVGSNDILDFARWDDKEGFNRLLELLDDEEALHVQQVLTDPEYFEHKERLGFVEKTKDIIESTHEKKKRVHPLINWAKRSLDDDYGITPIVLGLSIAAISMMAVLLLVSSLNDPRHAKLDGKTIANRVHLMLASTVKFGSTDGTIFLDTQTKIPTLAIALGKGGVQPTAGAGRVPVSKSTHLEGATYSDGEWCIAVSYGMGTAVYTNSGYQKKLSSCSR